MHRPLAIAAAAAALALASLAPAQAATQGTVIIQSGPTIEYRNLPSPPPPRMVARPGMRHGGADHHEIAGDVGGEQAEQRDEADDIDEACHESEAAGDEQGAARGVCGQDRHVHLSPSGRCAQVCMTSTHSG